MLRLFGKPALEFGGLALGYLLRLQANASNGGFYVKDKSIVLLFLAGRPIQLETFDPVLSKNSTVAVYASRVVQRLAGE